MCKSYSYSHSIYVTGGSASSWGSGCLALSYFPCKLFENVLIWLPRQVASFSTKFVYERSTFGWMPWTYRKYPDLISSPPFILLFYCNNCLNFFFCIPHVQTFSKNIYINKDIQLNCLYTHHEDRLTAPPT